MNTPAEYREQERMEIAFPQFSSDYCFSCHQPLDDEYATFNTHRHSGTHSMVIAVECCPACIAEVIQYRHRIRNVAEMTKEIVHQYNQSVYYRVYDSVNYKGHLHFAQKGI